MRISKLGEGSMNSSKKTSKRELLIKFSGPILFSLFFAALCVGIFKFLPEDAPINSEYIISVKETNNDEEEWQKSILVNPSEYHAKVVEHKTQKTDLGLELFRSPVSRPSVVWFYDQITGNQDVTLAILTAADANDIPLSLAFALAYTESRYKVTAVNSNSNKSIDRGLFQLNNRSFPNLSEEEFFDPYVSAKYGMSHLRFCLDTAGNEVSALAMYNAGTTKVRSNKTPQITLNYVSNIIGYREGLDVLFNTQVAIFYNQNSTSFLASLTR